MLWRSHNRNRRKKRTYPTPRRLFMVPKAVWANGPWHREPDSMGWQDRATGLRCLIKRNHVGALCGYVGVTRDHPAYGLSHDGAPYAEHRSYMDALRAKLRAPLLANDGSSEGHEAVSAVLAAAPSSPEPTAVGKLLCEVSVHGGLTWGAEWDQRGLWWFGFDCIHAWDLAPAMEALRVEMDRLRPMPDRLRKALARSRERDVYRDLAYVKAECAALAAQLEAIHA